MPLGYVPGASASSFTRPPSYLQTPRPPTVPAPPVPQDSTPASGENASPSEPSRVGTTHFSTVRSEVRSGAIRIDITNPEQWSAGDIAVLRNQEAKRVRDIGSLIFETPIQHSYESRSRGKIIALYRATRRGRWSLSCDVILTIQELDFCDRLMKFLLGATPSMRQSPQSSEKEVRAQACL